MNATPGDIILAGVIVGALLLGPYWWYERRDRKRALEVQSMTVKETTIMISISRVGALLLAIWFLLVGIAGLGFAAPVWLMTGLALIGGACLLTTAVRSLVTA